MQPFTRPRLISALPLFVMLLLALQSRAQLAYNYVPQPAETAAEADPEVGKPAAKPAMKTIHGVIQNEKGVLPGATVWLQGSRTIAVTNAEGEFELQVPAEASTVQLICGYGGLKEQVLTLAPVQAMGSIYLFQTGKEQKTFTAQ